MRSVPYASIETGVAAIAGIDPTNILAHEKVILAQYINDATRYCWDYYPWSETLITEERYFRDAWVDGTRYAIGDEVFYKDKYYRKWSDLFQDAFPPDELDWHEIGDIYSDLEWQEDGVYKIGARVTFDEKIYLCINNLAGTTPSGLKFVNYRFDGIEVTDTNYWMEIDPTFERFIPYEQEGFSTIGTMISAHVKDPRYNDATPLDWVEGREGIYISQPEHLNSVWLKYRAESPTYDSSNPTATVPTFLAPAIKAYSYRSWLIGDGQHEKAQLQDIHALDLLVREVDKLNNQQDRGQPYTISSEPYRRINARSNKPVDKTLDKVGEVKSRGVNSIILKTKTTSAGENAVRFRKSKTSLQIKGETKGIRRFAKLAMGYSSTRIYARIYARTAVVFATGSSYFKLFTGKASRATGIGEVKGIEQGEYRSVVEFKTTVRGVQAVKRATATSQKEITFQATGRQASRYAYVLIEPIHMTLYKVSRGRERQMLGQNINMEVEFLPVATGINPVIQQRIFNSKLAISSQASMVGWGSRAGWNDVNIHWENAA